MPAPGIRSGDKPRTVDTAVTASPYRNAATHKFQLAGLKLAAVKTSLGSTFRRVHQPTTLRTHEPDHVLRVDQSVHGQTRSKPRATAEQVTAEITARVRSVPRRAPRQLSH